jgi:hypothetical protein
VIASKRRDIGTRLGLAQSRGQLVPAVRTKLLKHSFELGRASVVKAQYGMSERSGQLWWESGKRIELFNGMISRSLHELDMAKAAHRYSRFANAVLRRIKLR